MCIILVVCSDERQYVPDTARGAAIPTGRSNLTVPYSWNNSTKTAKTLGIWLQTYLYSIYIYSLTSVPQLLAGLQLILVVPRTITVEPYDSCKTQCVVRPYIIHVGNIWYRVDECNLWQCLLNNLTRFVHCIELSGLSSHTFVRRTYLPIFLSICRCHLPWLFGGTRQWQHVVCQEFGHRQWRWANTKAPMQRAKCCRARRLERGGFMQQAGVYSQ